MRLNNDSYNPWAEAHEKGVKDTKKDKFLTDILSSKVWWMYNGNRGWKKLTKPSVFYKPNIEHGYLVQLHGHEHDNDDYTWQNIYGEGNKQNYKHNFSLEEPDETENY